MKISEALTPRCTTGRSLIYDALSSGSVRFFREDESIKGGIVRVTDSFILCSLTVDFAQVQEPRAFLITVSGLSDRHNNKLLPLANPLRLSLSVLLFSLVLVLVEASYLWTQFHL